MSPIKSGNVTMRSLPGEKHTPFGLARKLDAKVILESSSLSRGRERYSLLLVEEAFQIRQEGDTVVLLRGPERRVVGDPGDDILVVLEEIASRHEDVETDFPFPAGGIGFLSFEFAAYCDSMTFPDRPDSLGLPHCCVIPGLFFL